MFLKGNKTKSQFQKGYTPHNKGKIGYTNSGTFKKGHKINLGKKNCLGKKHSEKQNKKQSERMMGIKFSEATLRKMSETHKGKKQSKETIEKRLKIRREIGWWKNPEKERQRLSEARRGKKCNFWKGGITPENLKIRMGIENRLWREAVFSRDNYICQKCKIKGGKLHSHHIQNFSQYPELRFAIDNGITFCRNCHIDFHKIYGKQNNNWQQIKEFLFYEK